MRLGVVGMGLIGGSIALELKEKKWATDAIGYDLNEANRKEALELGLVDRVALSLDQLVKESDVICLAIPVDALEDTLEIALDMCRHEQIIFDVGSTKAGLISRAKGHEMRRNYVATHPMAGTEYSGPRAAHTGLFEGKVSVICDAEDSHAQAVGVIEGLYRTLGMNIVYHEAEDHDVHCAYVSHISHISSMALALTVLEKEKDENRIFELASAGFSSTVRLAKSEANTWIPIFKKNRDNVLDVLDEHINTISKFRSLLIKNDFETFHKLIQEANQIQKIIKK